MYMYEAVYMYSLTALDSGTGVDNLMALNSEISTDNLIPFNFPTAENGSPTALHSEKNTHNLMF